MQSIINQLVKQEWPVDAATELVNNIAVEVSNYQNSPQARRKLANQYARHMIYGILWAGGGTAVTVMTYSAASGGGTYVVAWGAIIYGIIDFFRGLFGWMKYS